MLFRSTSPNPKPEYRGEVIEPEVTIKDYWEFILKLVEMMIVWANSDSKRWARLVKAYPDIQRGWDVIGAMITSALRAVSVDTWDDKDKLTVKESLDNLIYHHSRFEDADWALPKSMIENLYTLRDKFVPAEKVMRYKAYFTYDPNDPDAPKDHYGDTWDKWLEGKREQVALEVYDENGLAGLFRLSEESAIPACVGQSVAALSFKEDEIAELVNKTLSINPSQFNESPLLQFGRGFVFTCYRRFGEKWFESILALKIHWTSEMQSNFAL